VPPVPDSRFPFLRFHLPALAWAVWSAFLFLQPGSGEVGRTGGPIFWALSLSSYWVDISAHVVFFAVMGWLAYRSFRRLSLRRPVVTAVLVTSVYGALLEFAQQYIPGRAVEIWDALANAAGAALAVGLAGWWDTRRSG